MRAETMARKEMLIFAQLSIIFFIAGVSGTIVDRPLNVATSVGGQAVFNCSINTTDVITWLHTTDCNLTRDVSLTVDNCDIKSNYTSHYNTCRTEKSNEFRCNLMVFDAVLSLGGCYACAESDASGTGSIHQAMLIIVDSNANISSNSTDLIPGEDVMISTKISFSGPSLSQQSPLLPPSFNWTLESDPYQNIASYPGLTTNTSASSYIVVTAQPPNVPPYLCILFFNSPVYVPIRCADNAPIYSRNWSTPTYRVSYNLPPSIIATSYFESDVCEAKVLSCQPNAYPAAVTYWMDAQQNISIYEEDITAEYMDEYLCVATNFYRNVSHQTTTTYSLSDREQFSQTPCQFAENSRIEIILSIDSRCDNITCVCPSCTDILLKCSASTLPEARYRWLFGDTATKGPTIKPTADGIYTCIAYNTVNNQNFTGNKSISISQFYEIQPTCPASDESTVIIVLSVILTISVLVIMGLMAWIMFWLIPKTRQIPGSTPTASDDISHQTIYENVQTLNGSPEPSPYESLQLQQQPTTASPVYEELTLRRSNVHPTSTKA